jgi:hypothetical protein
MASSGQMDGHKLKAKDAAEYPRTVLHQQITIQPKMSAVLLLKECELM